MLRLALILLVIGLVMGACSATRVLVKDCKDAGPDLVNCELVKML